MCFNNIFVFILHTFDALGINTNSRIYKCFPVIDSKVRESQTTITNTYIKTSFIRIYYIP
ncbi:hypothetical protein A0H76_1075 [Hepatospora eriocheir]|uniref:Uncharacterized protein n=1 Tax=Hepatospora eriocheir TaxID=1081669 RepID=A0A1X0QKW5_9MICR|nr:hypothetical protein A0H76_1075 [Hepatospora eriocheir]